MPILEDILSSKCTQATHKTTVQLGPPLRRIKSRSIKQPIPPIYPSPTHFPLQAPLPSVNEPTNVSFFCLSMILING
uniref:Uncharacterized protein n=2 Tax=Picea TaxID=3328 RepID=A0A117NGD7_PICGL|nr:hypothetical protein ABT39_MTgene1303 [Picea glauca]QHR89797.1 hypothetical protein Q903MT_gene3819 [Picea sitchensis]